jgi:hypothetical protein
MLCLHSCTVPTYFSRDRVFFHFCFYNSCQVFATKAFLPHRAEQILLQSCRWVLSLKKLFHLLQTSKKHSLCIHFMTWSLRRLQAIVCIVKTVKVRPHWVCANSGLFHDTHCRESPRTLGSNASEYFTFSAFLLATQCTNSINITM